MQQFSHCKVYDSGAPRAFAHGATSPRLVPERLFFSFSAAPMHAEVPRPGTEPTSHGSDNAGSLACYSSRAGSLTCGRDDAGSLTVVPPETQESVYSANTPVSGHPHLACRRGQRCCEHSRACLFARLRFFPVKLLGHLVTLPTAAAPLHVASAAHERFGFSTSSPTLVLFLFKNILAVLTVRGVCAAGGPAYSLTSPGVETFPCPVGVSMSWRNVSQVLCLVAAALQVLLVCLGCKNACRTCGLCPRPITGLPLAVGGEEAPAWRRGRGRAPSWALRSWALSSGAASSPESRAHPTPALGAATAVVTGPLALSLTVPGFWLLRARRGKGLCSVSAAKVREMLGFPETPSPRCAVAGVSLDLRGGRVCKQPLAKRPPSGLW